MMNAKAAAKRWADGDTIEASPVGLAEPQWTPVSQAGESQEPNSVDSGVFCKGSRYMFRLTKWWVPFNKKTLPKSPSTIWCLEGDVNRMGHKFTMTRVHMDSVMLSDGRFVSYIDLFDHWVYSTDGGQTWNRSGSEITQ